MTKYVHFFSIPSEYNTSRVEDIFFREFFRLHGVLRYIVSDRDKIFLNVFCHDFFRLSGTEFTPITTYQPQTNG
jgi:hypothetical protein